MQPFTDWFDLDIHLYKVAIESVICVTSLANPDLIQSLHLAHEKIDSEWSNNLDILKKKKF